MAWHADLEWVGPEDADDYAGDRLPVARRGRLEEGAARSVGGGGSVREQRTWARSAKAGVVPSHRSGSDVSAALAMAQLSGPLEPLLLLVCCEDLARWPEVKRFAIASLAHPLGEAAVTDAMHRILWRRPVMPLEARARSLRARKENYAKVRQMAETTIRDWLAEAAQRFLIALR